MKNKDNQKSFLKKCYQYSADAMGSLMGIDARCGHCSHQIGKPGSPTHNDQTVNCSIADKPDDYFISKTPCATAYNRMKRKM